MTQEQIDQIIKAVEWMLVDYEHLNVMGQPLAANWEDRVKVVKEAISTLQSAHARYAMPECHSVIDGKRTEDMDNKELRYHLQESSKIMQRQADEIAELKARYADTGKQTRTKLPEGIDRVRNAATGEFVGYAGGGEAVAYLDEDGRVVRVSVDGSGDGGFVSPNRAIPDSWKPLYTHPDPAVPDARELPENFSSWDNGFTDGWNACREAMLTASQEGK